MLLRRPYRIRGRFKRDGLCVRDAIAQHRFLTAADHGRTRIESYNLKLVPSHSFIRLFGLCLPLSRKTLFNLAVSLPARMKDPSKVREREAYRDCGPNPVEPHSELPSGLP